MSTPVAIVFRDPPPGRPERGWLRFEAVATALRMAGFEPRPCAFDEARTDAARAGLRACAAALVWVNPVQDGRTRESLNALLRETAKAGVFVSTHPDIVETLGVKSVVARLPLRGWSTHARYYATPHELQAGLAETVRLGPRVLKPNRGNDGRGVRKVSAIGPSQVEVQAADGEPHRKLSLLALLDELVAEFPDGGGFLDQAYQPRIREGMIRCYLVGDRVAGFGTQAGVALGAPLTPRIYADANDPSFQLFRRRIEAEWLPYLIAALDLTDLPLLWDADFMLGPRAESGSDSYVLCEINVSSVFPMPPSAPPMIAESLRARLR